MTDGYTVLNPGIGGDTMDETEVAYVDVPLVRKRPRVVLTGEGANDIVDTADDLPNSYSRGLVVREARKGQTTSDDSIPVVISSDQKIGKSNVVVFQETIGTSELQLANNPLSYSVTVKALNGNSAVVYVGVSGVDASNGFELNAGESISLSIDNTNRLYVIASDVNQKICLIGI
ncbi:MAG: hypothetical protein WCJ72_02400 [Chryseobacterium sp.]